MDRALVYSLSNVVKESRYQICNDGLKVVITYLTSKRYNDGTAQRWNPSIFSGLP